MASSNSCNKCPKDKNSDNCEGFLTSLGPLSGGIWPECSWGVQEHCTVKERECARPWPQTKSNKETLFPFCWSQTWSSSRCGQCGLRSFRVKFPKFFLPFVQVKTRKWTGHCLRIIRRACLFLKCCKYVGPAARTPRPAGDPDLAAVRGIWDGEEEFMKQSCREDVGLPEMPVGKGDWGRAWKRV